ncbi:TIGR03745 family integrating conjugative element membrane protein [Salinisphaera hydrothermalis]|uniref:Integrating conjugative element membrane protein n=1 Tax=Salinisphaera hydrothermalis (strain C41B8) TaxID=1304275 RepID=A0A084IJ08_SALHC|nr:TIGR03745 family integrating conjugative element membrane protein [Salinisphaera hydrothermalis]KEZ76692.1 integrating conjugative element membrane protein [Salinisphaera hydrothermalis C41B8]
MKNLTRLYPRAMAPDRRHRWLSTGLSVLAALLLIGLPVLGWADGLPDVGDPGSGGGILDDTQQMAGSAAVLVGLLLAAAAMYYVVGAAISQYNEATMGRGNWGGFAMALVVGIAMIILIVWLLDKASSILGS